MKSASLLWALAVLLAISATGGAYAQVISGAGSEEECIRNGGRVVVDSNGNKICRPGPSKQGREPPNHS